MLFSLGQANRLDGFGVIRTIDRSPLGTVLNHFTREILAQFTHGRITALVNGTLQYVSGILHTRKHGIVYTIHGFAITAASASVCRILSTALVLVIPLRVIACQGRIIILFHGIVIEARCTTPLRRSFSVIEWMVALETLTTSTPTTSSSPATSTASSA